MPRTRPRIHIFQKPAGWSVHGHRFTEEVTMAIDIRRRFAAITVIGGVILLTLFPRFAAAERPSRVRDLHGAYKGSGLEIRHDTGFEIEYCQIVGPVEFDGHGSLSVDAIRRCTLTGTFHEVDTGTYTVSSDGDVVFAFDSGDGAKGVVGDRGTIVILDNFNAADPGGPVLIFHAAFVKVS